MRSSTARCRDPTFLPSSAARASRKVTVESYLKSQGWKLERQKKHLVFRRIVQGRKETFVTSKTPSDSRAGKNALATARRMEPLEGAPIWHHQGVTW